jgi:hypothetical protein
MTIDVCSECGYPTLGPDLCYFCQPLAAKTLALFASSLAGPTDTAEETSVVVRTTARPPREPRADAECSLSSTVTSTFAAAG